MATPPGHLVPRAVLPLPRGPKADLLEAGLLEADPLAVPPARADQEPALEGVTIPVLPAAVPVVVPRAAAPARKGAAVVPRVVPMDAVPPVAVLTTGEDPPGVPTVGEDPVAVLTSVAQAGVAPRAVAQARAVPKAARQAVAVLMAVGQGEPVPRAAVAEAHPAPAAAP